MSGYLMGVVLDWSRADDTARSVLLCIADRAKDDGTGARPPIAELVRRSRKSKSTVLRALVRLEILGELEIERRSTAVYRRVNRYVVTLRPGVTAMTPVVVSPRRHLSGVTQMTPHTSVRPCTSVAKVTEIWG